MERYPMDCHMAFSFPGRNRQLVCRSGGVALPSLRDSWAQCCRRPIDPGYSVVSFPPYSDFASVEREKDTGRSVNHFGFDNACDNPCHLLGVAPLAFRYTDQKCRDARL